MVLEDEKVLENRRLRRLGGPENCQHSYLPTFSPSHLFTRRLSGGLTFLLSYSSRHLCLFVFIRGSPYPFSSFLFPVSSLRDLTILLTSRGKSCSFFGLRMYLFVFLRGYK